MLCLESRASQHAYTRLHLVVPRRCPPGAQLPKGRRTCPIFFSGSNCARMLLACASASAVDSLLPMSAIASHAICTPPVHLTSGAMPQVEMSAPPSTSAGEDMGDSVRRKRSRRLFDDDLASASQPSGAGTTLPATEFGAQSASADASSNESESETDDEHEHMANKLLRSLVKASKTGNADRAPLRGGISAMWKMHERLRAANHRKVRRWCLYEFVYPAIDVPFFAHNEFETCLQQLGLSRVLTSSHSRTPAHPKLRPAPPCSLSRGPADRRPCSRWPICGHRSPKNPLAVCLPRHMRHPG